MLTEFDVLRVMDHSNNGPYYTFVQLGHVYWYLIDARLNIFRNDHGQWAIAIERLGYNPRGGGIDLQINYFGNCLINLDTYLQFTVNNYYIDIVDNIAETTDCEDISKDAEYWIIRGHKIALSHDKQDYFNAGITLKEYEPDAIGIEEAARLAILQNASLFRATDDELQKSIPKDLKKILVLDEWYHREFYLRQTPDISHEILDESFEINRTGYSKIGLTQDSFHELYKNHKYEMDEMDRETWENCRPSVYETWQQLAKVIATGDVSLYQPTLEPNTHWRFYPESGTY